MLGKIGPDDQCSRIWGMGHGRLAMDASRLLFMMGKTKQSCGNNNIPSLPSNATAAAVDNSNSPDKIQEEGEINEYIKIPVVPHKAVAEVSK